MANKKPLDYFFDLTSLKIMLVLYRDNPDVSYGALQREINVEPSKLSEKLAELIDADLINVKNQGKTKLFTLSMQARMSLNRLGMKNKRLDGRGKQCR